MVLWSKMMDRDEISMFERHIVSETIFKNDKMFHFAQWHSIGEMVIEQF
ncbi:MAG TPA: hypothetical protein VKZ44_09175 [Taishania sp.]|nr:hypothetical protein [Taishania sp.]